MQINEKVDKSSPNNSYGRTGVENVTMILTSGDGLKLIRIERGTNSIRIWKLKECKHDGFKSLQ